MSMMIRLSGKNGDGPDRDHCDMAQCEDGYIEMHGFKDEMIIIKARFKEGYIAFLECDKLT